MTIFSIYTMFSAGFFGTQKQHKGDSLAISSSVGSGREQDDESSSIVNKVAKVGDYLIISDITKQETEQLISILAREDLLIYEKIIFSNCYIAKNMFEIAELYDQKYKQNVVFSLVKCQLSHEILEDLKNKDYPKLNYFILEINGQIIILPRQKNQDFQKVIDVPKSVGYSIGFIKDYKILCQDTKFSDAQAVDFLNKCCQSTQNLRSIILKNAILDDKFATIANTVNNFTQFSSIIIEKSGKFNLNMFKGKNFTTRNDDKIIASNEIITIPESLVSHIMINSAKIITIKDVLLFKEANAAEIISFLNQCLQNLSGIEFEKCKIDKNFLHFTNKLNVPNGHNKILKFNKCDSRHGQNFADDLQAKLLKINNLIFQWNSAIYANGNQLSSSILKLDKSNFESLCLLLQNNNFVYNFEIIKISDVELDKKHTNLLIDLLENENITGGVTCLKFNNCVFFDYSIQCVDTIKNQDTIKKFFLINIAETEHSRHFLQALKSVQFSSIFFVDDRFEGVDLNKSTSKNQIGKPYNPSFQKLLNELKTDPNGKYKIDILKTFAPCMPGLPGQTLAEATGRNFSPIDIQKIEQNILLILDSWIVGYAQQKEQLSRILLNFMIQRNMGQDKFPLLYGPPGIGKTTFIHAIAAVLKYADTGNLAECLYDPKLGTKKVEDWFFIESLSTISSIEYISGFAKTYSDSKPGIISHLATNNPAVFCKVLGMDEIDKFKGQNGKEGIMNTLISMLEQNQRKAYVDIHINAPFNLSYVLIVLTGNDETTLPEYIKSRVEMIKIPPLTNDEFRKVALVKWDDVLKINNLGKNDYDWPNESFFWFVEYIGPKNMRDLTSNYSKLAQRIVMSKNNGKKLILSKQFLLELFPDLFNQVQYVENTPGYALGVFEDASGAFKTILIAASSIGRDRGEKVIFLPTTEQNKDNAVHGARTSYQILITAILYNLQQNSGPLEVYKIKLGNSFVVEPQSSFNLHETNYFAVQAVLSIVSSVSAKAIDHILAIGHVDITGHFACPKEATSIVYRLSTALVVNNKMIKKIFLPKNLPKEHQAQCHGFIKSWCEACNMKISNIHVFYVDTIQEIVANILEEEDRAKSNDKSH